jgi:hypothetical protein
LEIFTVIFPNVGKNALTPALSRGERESGHTLSPWERVGGEKKKVPDTVAGADDISDSDISAHAGTMEIRSGARTVLAAGEWIGAKPSRTWASCPTRVCDGPVVIPSPLRVRNLARRTER